MVPVAIGVQDFSTLIENGYFYIDKTSFLKEWWDCGDSVTLIARPRRFGKTLTMSMVEQFFSLEYKGRADLNNLKVVTTTSDEYATTFGFTEEEVFHALEQQGLGAEKQEVKRWYDGFIFGKLVCSCGAGL